MKKADDAGIDQFRAIAKLLSSHYPEIPPRLISQIHLTRHGPGCWDWGGYLRDNGYGQKWKDGRLTGSHRAAYEYLHGPIPEGLDLDHLCRNHGCINPAHLEPVTRRENNLRGLLPHINKSRSAVRTTCRHGHPLTPENTRHYKGRRLCRHCARDRYHQMKREEQQNGKVA